MSNGDNYFTDADALSNYMQDTRAADNRTVSSATDAKSLVDAFRSSTATSPWTSLNRDDVADRLTALVDNPRLLQQGSLNLCGPASFLLCWNSRDPVGFVNYATTLFDTGQSKIGSMAVTSSADLLTQDYSAMYDRMTVKSPQADWMTMGALRNSTDVFWQGTWTGDPSQKLSGMSRPEEVAGWLQSTGIYSQVRNEANWATAKGIPHATGLSLQPGTDIILLINANLIQAAKGSPVDSNWLFKQFPNHYIVLVTEIVQNVTTQDIQFVPWSWGTKLVSDRQSPITQPPLGGTYDDSNKGRYLSVPMQAFVDNYYGAIIATMPAPSDTLSSAANSSSSSSGDSSSSSSAQSSSDESSSSGDTGSASGDSSGVATDTAADSSTGPSSPVNIHYDVSLVAQPDDCTCWAASSAMILSYWHDVETSSSNPSYSVQEIKDLVASTGPQYDISRGLKPEDTKPVGDILGLSFDYPMCYGVDGFASVLKDKGPVVFIRAPASGKGSHAIAVIGMNGDGTPDGTTVETLNPSPVGTGAAQNVSFTILMSMMEKRGFWDQEKTGWSKATSLDRVYVMYKQ